MSSRSRQSGGNSHSPRIIDDELWEAVKTRQAEIADNAKETNRLNRERRASGGGHPSELAKIHRTLKQMLSAIEEGGHTRSMTERMRELEAREDALKELLAEEPADIPDIHPNVSGIYRKKVERLTEALNAPEDRNEAAEAIRALVEKITLRLVRTAAKSTQLTR